MRTCTASFFFVSCLSCVLAGCGVRTGLEIVSDGGDAGHGFDGSGRDVGVPDSSWDGGACTGNAQCDDLVFCNGVETCVGGHCQRGVPTNCDDGVSCTSDQCVEGGGCVSRPNDMLCPPGLRCNPMIGCVPDMMRCMSDFDCDDRNACNGRERCDPGSGRCIAGDPMFCGDGVTCTDDQCIDGVGCVHSANSSECPLGQICDPMAGCQTRSCGPMGRCDDGDPCNGNEFCAADGRCVPGSPLVCNDGNACTTDFCVTGRGCQFATHAEICNDGVDNDCNGRTDCMDPICMGTPACGMMCVPVAPIEFNCNDGRDDDCNGLRDCADPACAGRPPCMGMCVPIGPVETNCFDGRDDDCDGRIDCADPDCAGPMCGVCTFPENCHNGIDDDCNGPADCMDPFCIMTDPTCGMMCIPTAPFERRCADGLDDDCDGQIDCADRDCRGRGACNDAGPPTLDAGFPDSSFFDSGIVTNEIGVAACTNGIDDDRDGRIDCADPDCRPFGPMGECCNGIDDTGDGNIDEFTCRCFDQSFCGSVGSLDQVCWLNSYSVCAPRCNFYGGNTFCMMNLPGTPTCNAMTGECQ